MRCQRLKCRDHALFLDQTGNDLFLILDGVAIAKRGHPGTPQAKTWVSLEPGYTIVLSRDLSEIYIKIDPAGRAVQ
jgi:hypothetical protein